MEIRPGQESDIDAILSLIEELMEPPGSRPAGYRRTDAGANVREAVKSADADILLAVEGGKALGLATVYATFPAIRYGRRCHLEELVVTSSRRSAGIGKALLDAATGWARQHGCTHLQLDSSLGRKDSHRFYMREGMAQTSYVFKRIFE